MGRASRNKRSRRGGGRELPVLQPPAAAVDGSSSPGQGRACGSCQACCFILPVWFDNQTDGVPDKEHYTKCRHQCATGCAIYETRPSPCAAYSCMWKLGWAVDDDDRPDKLGLCIEALQEGIVTINEVWAGASTSERAQIRMAQIRQQVPYVLVVPFGAPEERGVVDPPDDYLEEIPRRLEAAWKRMGGGAVGPRIPRSP